MTRIEDSTPPGYWFGVIEARLRQTMRDELSDLGLRRGGWRILHTLADRPASAEELAAAMPSRGAGHGGRGDGRGFGGAGREERDARDPRGERDPHGEPRWHGRPGPREEHGWRREPGWRYGREGRPEDERDLRGDGDGRGPSDGRAEHDARGPHDGHAERDARGPHDEHAERDARGPSDERTERDARGPHDGREYGDPRDWRYGRDPRDWRGRPDDRGPRWWRDERSERDGGDGGPESRDYPHDRLHDHFHDRFGHPPFPHDGHPHDAHPHGFEHGFERGFERGFLRGAWVTSFTGGPGPRGGYGGFAGPRFGGRRGNPRAPFGPWPHGSRAGRIERILAAFVERGWVWFDGDRATLTEEGRAAHDAAFERIRELRERVTAGVDEEDFATTMATLEKMARNLGWTPEPETPASDTAEPDQNPTS